VDLDGLVVLPLYASGPRREYKREVYQSLLEDYRRREMESGLLLLIQAIGRRIVEITDGSWEQFREYVLNYEGTWGSVDNTDNAETEALDEDSRRALERDLADLDTAILSSIEDLERPLDTLAAALHEALESSLWRRRLERQSSSYTRIQETLLEGRSRWLWRKTTTSQRRGFFAAGLGFQAGRYLDDHLDDLLEDLLASENAVVEGDIDAVGRHVTSMATVLFEVHPFRPQHQGAGWEVTVLTWLHGRPLSTVASDAPSEAVQFIQDDVVYRLVWAIEAVRALGVERGEAEAGDIEGLVSLLLTYGVPSQQAALLVSAGLKSRRMATRLTADFPSSFHNHFGLRLWLEGVRAEMAPEYWSAEELEAWNAFLGRLDSPAQQEWVEEELQVQAQWTVSSPPETGEKVALIQDSATHKTVVTTPDLERIGWLRGGVPQVTGGRYSAVVGPDRRTLTLTRFGPPRQRGAE